MITLVLMVVLTMAEPTHVYEVTWESAKTEAETTAALSGFKVLQVKKLGVASTQKKWSVVIQSSSVKTRVRDDLKKVSGVQRVKVTD